MNLLLFYPYPPLNVVLPGEKTHLIIEQKFNHVNAKWFEFSKRPFEKGDSLHTGRVRDHAPTGKHNHILNASISPYDFSNGFKPFLGLRNGFS